MVDVGLGCYRIFFQYILYQTEILEGYRDGTLSWHHPYSIYILSWIVHVNLSSFDDFRNN
jgi:hypothetical protein